MKSVVVRDLRVIALPWVKLVAVGGNLMTSLNLASRCPECRQLFNQNDPELGHLNTGRIGLEELDRLDQLNDPDALSELRAFGWDIVLDDLGVHLVDIEG